MWQQIGEAAMALIPSIGLLGLFILIVRAMILADRRERLQRAKEDAEVYAEPSSDESKN